MKKENLLKPLLPLSVLILGALLCATSFYPDLKNNTYCIAITMLASLVILGFIISEFSRSRYRKRNTGKPLTKEEIWKTLVIHYLTTEIEINNRKEITPFLLAIFRRIDHLHQFQNTAELQKIIDSYIITPQEQLIEYITPYCASGQLVQFKTDTFQSLLNIVRPKIAEKLKILKM